MNDVAFEMIVYTNIFSHFEYQKQQEWSIIIVQYYHRLYYYSIDMAAPGRSYNVE